MSTAPASNTARPAAKGADPALVRVAVDRLVAHPGTRFTRRKDARDFIRARFDQGTLSAADLAVIAAGSADLLTVLTYPDPTGNTAVANLTRP